jgi:hypothetical protein
MASDLLEFAKANGNYFKENIVTDDETWYMGLSLLII